MAGTSTKPTQARAGVSTPTSGNAVDFIDSTDDAQGVPVTKRSDGTFFIPLKTGAAVTSLGAGNATTIAGTATVPIVNVTVDNATLDIAASALEVKALGVGTGQLATNGVTNAKLATMAASTVKGSVAGGTPVDLTQIQLTGLVLVDGVTLDAAGAGSSLEVKALGIGTGQIAAAAVTNAKLANMTGPSVKGQVTGTAAPIDLTPTQVTASLVNDATGSLPGRMTTTQFAQLLVFGFEQAGIFNVQAAPYNAKGDGSTDDTAAINAAIAAANAYLAPSASQRGAIVYFPPGIYRTLAGLTSITGNGVQLVGAGIGASTIYVGHATADIVTFGSGTEFCELRNLQFFNQVTRTAGSYIVTNGANDLLIRDFTMTGHFVGITVSGGGIKNYIERGTINSAAQTTSIGIDVLNGAAGDTYISDIVMSNGGTIPAAGIRLRQTGHLSLHDCNITKCDIGLLIDPQTTDVTYLFIDTCLFDTCVSAAMKLNPANSASARIRSVKIVNSWFAGSSGANAPGVNMTSAGASAIVDAFSFHGCRFLNNGGNGITLAFGTNVFLDGCTIAGNSVTSSNTLDGVSVAAAITDFRVIGCRIGPVGTATNTQRFAINVLAGASNRYTIRSNDLRGNGNGAGTGGAFQNLGTGTIQSIGDNLGGPLTGLPMVAASAAINTTDTVLATAPAGSNGMNPGTTYEITLEGTCTASVANLSTFTVRLGIAGTTADATIATFTVTSAATGTTIPFAVRIKLTFRTVGATGTVSGSLYTLSQGLATGTSSGIEAFSVSTSRAASVAAPNTTLNDLILSVSYKSAATTTTSTFQEGQVELKRAA